MAIGNDRKFRMDMCHGPLFSQIVRFSLPLFMSQMIQLLFNAADLIVVGRYAEHEAMAAVGSTASVTFLLINVFFGLSIGTNVMAANFYGAKDDVNLSRTTHTAILIALLGGFLSGGLGFGLSRTLLRMMSSPVNVIDKATLYMRIYFMGMPFLLLYNFGSSILRALGDTKRPLIYLAIAGVINVVLNMYFVICLHWDVAGVACATVISQGVSCVLVLRALMMADDDCRLQIRKLRIHGAILKQMMGIGLPAAVQASCFSLANVIIQSSVNSFGSLAMAGNAAAVSLEGMVYVGSFTYHQTAISFAGQNLGGHEYGRIVRSFWYCMALTTAICILMGYGGYFWGRNLLSIYNPDPEVIDWGMRRLKVLFTTYFLCGTMDAVSGAMRGLGHSLMSAISNLAGVCVLRIVWIFTFFQVNRTMECLMMTYPLSWAVTTMVNGFMLWYFIRKLTRNAEC